MRFVDPDSFGFLVTDLTRLLRAEMDRLIAEAGLGITPADARTLVHAARAGAVKQALLAERVGVEAMTVSASLDRLEAMGLVERRPDPTDRRVNLVHVTDAGAAMLKRMQPFTAALRDAAGTGIGADEWSGMIETMKQARINLCAARDARKAADAA
jgi:DNA-binding MarR family transcriptional regulator